MRKSIGMGRNCSVSDSSLQFLSLSIVERITLCATFGRDLITPFLSLLEPSPQYWGKRGGHLHLYALQWLYAVMAENLKRARGKKTTETETNLQNDLKIGDLVLVRNVN